MSIAQPGAVADASAGPATAHRADTPPPGLPSVPAARVHDYARRVAFLNELDSQTWLARYSAAERLGDPGAVASPAAYAAWLRRVGAAWHTVPMPTIAQATTVWPFQTLTPTALDSIGQIEADLREVALAGGGPRTSVTTRAPVASSAVAPAEDVDAAYVAGAVYVAVCAAQEVSVLSADVQHLSATASRTPLPQHYLRHSTQIAALRGLVRRELAEWADGVGPAAAERIVLTARMLNEQLGAALTSPARSRGW